MNNDFDYYVEKNTYQKLSGYVLNENYISKEIKKYITSCR